MNSKFRLVLIAAAFLTWGAASVRIAWAEPQQPGCSMLTPAQIQKVLGQPFGAPTVTQAPPAYAKQSWGSNCRYSSEQGRHVVVNFIVYVDASPSEARETFAKLSMWYSAKSKPAIGNSAYIDSDGAIHVLKGKVRFYISINPKDEKQLKDLASAVATRI